MTTTNKIKELQSKIKDFQKKIKEESKNLFNDFAQEIFEQYPVVEKFGWTQYTPYFNDGDTCYFGVGETYVNDYDQYECDYEIEAAIKKAKPGYKKEIQEKLNEQKVLKEHAVAGNNFREAQQCLDKIKALEEELKYSTDESVADLKSLLEANKLINKSIQSFESDILKAIFGDHVRVEVTKKGVKTTEYDHD